LGPTAATTPYLLFPPRWGWGPPPPPPPSGPRPVTDVRCRRLQTWCSRWAPPDVLGVLPCLAHRRVAGNCGWSKERSRSLRAWRQGGRRAIEPVHAPGAGNSCARCPDLVPTWFRRLNIAEAIVLPKDFEGWRYVIVRPPSACAGRTRTQTIPDREKFRSAGYRSSVVDNLPALTEPATPPNSNPHLPDIRLSHSLKVAQQ